MSSGHNNNVITIDHGTSLSNKQSEYERSGIQPSNNKEYDEFDIHRLIDLLKRRKWLIISSTALIAILFLVHALSQIPIYRASASIKISMDGDKLTHFENGVKESSLPGLLFFNAQLEILKSQQLAERVVAKLNIPSSPPSTIKESPSQTSLLTSARTVFNSSLTEASSFLTGGISKEMANKAGTPPSVSRFISGISVDTNKHEKNGHTIASVQYDSINPELAAKSVNLLVNEMVQMDLEKRLSKNIKAKTYLEEQLLSAKKRLQDSENQLISYSKEKEVFHTEKYQSLASKALVELNKTYLEARNILINTKSEYFQELDHPINSQLLSSAALESLQHRKSSLESQYQKDLLTYKPSFPVMRELQRQINSLKQQISEQRNTLKANNIAMLKTRYLAAQEKEQLLAKELHLKKADIIDEKKQTVGYSALYREVETNRSMYEQLLQHLKEVSIAQGMTNSNISIIDEAYVPYSPISPNITKEFQTGILVGLIVGLLLAFIREFFDNKIRTSADLEKLSLLPVLGVIPYTKQHKKRHLPLDFGPQYSIGSEAFHSLITNLDYISEEGIPQILHITSACPSEGKSHTAIQLAKTLADSENDLRVLLIDADLRKPSLARYLDENHQKTLSDYLRGKASIDDIIIKSKTSNLSLISDKGAPCNPAKLLAGDRFIALLDQATQRFDYIIIDSPPVLGLADALILANRAMATLFVVSSCETRKMHFKDALKRIKLGYGNLTGFVLTKSKDINASYYGHDYYYGPSRKKRLAKQTEASLVSDPAHTAQG